MATSPPIFEDASFDPEMTGIMVEAYEKPLSMASRHRTAEGRQGVHRNNGSSRTLKPRMRSDPALRGGLKTLHIFGGIERC
jgi:hypothetical protein